MNEEPFSHRWCNGYILSIHPWKSIYCNKITTTSVFHVSFNISWCTTPKQHQRPTSFHCIRKKKIFFFSLTSSIVTLSISIKILRYIE